MHSLEHAHNVVGAWFAIHDADERHHRAMRPGDTDALMVWSIRYRGLDLIVAVEALDRGVNLQLSAPVLSLTPETSPGLLSALLRLNREALVGYAFALDDDDDIVIVADREAERLDAGALERLVAGIHEAADAFAAELAARFRAMSLLGGEEE